MKVWNPALVSMMVTSETHVAVGRGSRGKSLISRYTLGCRPKKRVWGDCCLMLDIERLALPASRLLKASDSLGGCGCSIGRKCPIPGNPSDLHLDLEEFRAAHLQGSLGHSCP